MVDTEIFRQGGRRQPVLKKRRAQPFVRHPPNRVRRDGKGRLNPSRDDLRTPLALMSPP
jgi:hypothetical protein